MTVIVVGIALILSVLYTTRRLEEQPPDSAMPAQLKGLADALQASGQNGLNDYLKRLELESGVRAFVFDETGREIFNQAPSPEILKMAVAAGQRGGVFLSGNAAAERMAGPGGKSYSVVLLGPKDSKAAPIGSVQRTVKGLFGITAISLIGGGLFCYLITRHITAPLVRLREAAAAIAEGRLDTRVSPALGYRRDEIADLGRDFDRMAERIETL